MERKRLNSTQKICTHTCARRPLLLSFFLLNTKSWHYQSLKKRLQLWRHHHPNAQSTYTQAAAARPQSAIQTAILISGLRRMLTDWDVGTAGAFTNSTTRKEYATRRLLRLPITLLMCNLSKRANQIANTVSSIWQEQFLAELINCQRSCLTW